MNPIAPNDVTTNMNNPAMVRKISDLVILKNVFMFLTPYSLVSKRTRFAYTRKQSR